MQQIRRGDQKAILQRLSVEIPAIAMEYGATAELPASTLKECVNLVFTRFAFLSTGEIREAYRQWATEETTNKMYGGKFSVAQFGWVLSAYNKKRRKVLAAILETKQQEARAAAAAKKAEIEKAAFEAEFPKIIADLKETASSWQDVPEYLYKACLTRGMIEFAPGEGQNILAEAKELLVKEKEKERLSRKLDPFSGISDEDKAKRIARILTVYRKVIKI